jgi:hypothetical protein
MAAEYFQNPGVNPNSVGNSYGILWNNINYIKSVLVQTMALNIIEI